jgi:hypothetical protein
MPKGHQEEKFEAQKRPRAPKQIQMSKIGKIQQRDSLPRLYDSSTGEIPRPIPTWSLPRLRLSSMQISSTMGGVSDQPQALLVKFGQPEMVAIDPVEDAELYRPNRWGVRNLILRRYEWSYL